jgi:hypothetical protein
MSQWELFEKLVVSEECRNSGRNLASELRRASHSSEESLSMPMERLGANFSRWLGKILVASGERLLDFAANGKAGSEFSPMVGEDFGN